MVTQAGKSQFSGKKLNWLILVQKYQPEKDKQENGTI